MEKINNCLRDIKPQMEELIGYSISREILSHYNDKVSGLRVLKLSLIPIAKCALQSKQPKKCLKQFEIPIIGQYEISLLKESKDKKFSKDIKRNPKLNKYYNMIFKNPIMIRCLGMARRNHDTTALKKCDNSIDLMITKEINNYQKITPEKKQVFDAFYADIEPLVRPLEHDISVFHWTKGHRTWMGKGNYVDFYSHMFNWPITDQAEDKNWVGQGLYAAVDPFHSSPKGRDWQETDGFGRTLLEIKVKKGANILDLSKEINLISISERTQKLLKKHDCEVKVLAKKQAYMDNKNCRTIFLEVIEKLNVKIISYDYTSFNRLPVKFCDRNFQMAFVIVDTPTDSDSIIKYTLDEAKNLEKGDGYYEKYKRLGSMFNMNNKNLSNNSIKNKRYWKDRIYGCDSKYKNDIPMRQLPD